MTFTEAAVEVLRRAGKPLHFKEITEKAIEDGLLSHVGQIPEETMGGRLFAMARRERDRRVSALGAGVYALSEWNLAVEGQVDENDSGLDDLEKDTGPAYRPRERHPPLQPEVLVGGRREDRGRRGDDSSERRRKRFPPPAEVAHQWLRNHGNAAPLAELARALRAQELIAEALERDLNSLERALRQENRRCSDSGRSPAFAFEQGQVRALVSQALKTTSKREQGAVVEEQEGEEAIPALENQRRLVLRSARRRIAALDQGALERAVVALLEAQGFREINLASRHTREGSLFQARKRWGSNELRYTIRLLPPGRDIGRAEVSDIRPLLRRYSSQLAMVFGSAECAREAKSEANLPNQPPVMLFSGEALAEELVDSGLAARKHLVEWLEFNPDFFASLGADAALLLPTEDEGTSEKGHGGSEGSRDNRDKGKRNRNKRRNGGSGSSDRGGGEREAGERSSGERSDRSSNERSPNDRASGERATAESSSNERAGSKGDGAAKGGRQDAGSEGEKSTPASKGESQERPAVKSRSLRRSRRRRARGSKGESGADADQAGDRSAGSDLAASKVDEKGRGRDEGAGSKPASKASTESSSASASTAEPSASSAASNKANSNKALTAHAESGAESRAKGGAKASSSGRRSEVSSGPEGRAGDSGSSTGSRPSDTSAPDKSSASAAPSESSATGSSQKNAGEQAASASGDESGTAAASTRGRRRGRYASARSRGGAEKEEGPEAGSEGSSENSGKGSEARKAEETMKSGGTKASEEA